MKNSKLSFFIAIVMMTIFATSCSHKTLEVSSAPTVLNSLSHNKFQPKTYKLFNAPNKDLVAFSVVHNGDLAKMLTNKDSNFKALLETYGLQIKKRFEINESLNVVVLVPIMELENPMEVGNEISLLDEVLLVDIEGVKTDTHDPDVVK